MTPLPAGVRVPSLLRSGAADPDLLDETLRTLWPLPKVELHLHLEGAPRVETICEMARQHEPLSRFCEAGWHLDYWTFRDLAGFVVELREVLRDCLRTPEDYYRIAYECFEDLAAQHVLYAELNFSPRLPDRPHYLPQDEMLAAIDQARRDVEARTSFRAGLLLGLPRDPQGVDPALLEAVTCQFVESALEAREKGVRVVGMDLHGDEQTAPDVGPFVAAYRLARQAGLGVRAHAGEGGGAAVVRESLDRLKVQRVAHGVRATEDPALMQRLATEGVVLDICPTSNVLTGTAASLEQHPIRAIEQAGVIVTVSSDDPLVFDTTVTTELALLQLRLGYAREELGRLSAQAAEHSFLPDAERSTLVERVRDGWI